MEQTLPPWPLSSFRHRPRSWGEKRGASPQDPRGPERTPAAARRPLPPGSQPPPPPPSAGGEPCQGCALFRMFSKMSGPRSFTEQKSVSWGAGRKSYERGKVRPRAGKNLRSARGSLASRRRLGPGPIYSPPGALGSAALSPCVLIPARQTQVPSEPEVSSLSSRSACECVRHVGRRAWPAHRALRGDDGCQVTDSRFWRGASR